MDALYGECEWKKKTINRSVLKRLGGGEREEEEEEEREGLGGGLCEVLRD